MAITYTLTEIKPFINSMVYSALIRKVENTETETYYDKIKIEAEKVIYANSSYTSTDDMTAFILLPYCYVVQYLALPLLSEISKEMQEFINDKYDFAIELLHRNPKINSETGEEEPLADKSSSFTKQLTGLYEI